MAFFRKCDTTTDHKYFTVEVVHLVECSVEVVVRILAEEDSLVVADILAVVACLVVVGNLGNLAVVGILVVVGSPVVDILAEV